MIIAKKKVTSISQVICPRVIFLGFGVPIREKHATMPKIKVTYMLLVYLEQNFSELLYLIKDIKNMNVTFY